MEAPSFNEPCLRMDSKNSIDVPSYTIVGGRVRQVTQLDSLVGGLAWSTWGKDNALAWSCLHYWDEAQRTGTKAMADTLDASSQGRHHLSMLQILFQLGLHCLVGLQCLEQCKLGFQSLQLPFLEILQRLLAHLVVVSNGKELHLLEKVVVGFQRTECKVESAGGSCL